jgi:hypothetical protein
MRMPVGLKEGSIVELTFLDHVEDGPEPIEFMVWGRVSGMTKRSLSVECWGYASKVDEASHGDHNIKSFTIVKRAVTAISLLKKVR